jgi:hypothetical protein
MVMDSTSLNVCCEAFVLIVLCILHSLHSVNSDEFASMALHVDEDLPRKTAQLVISTAALFDYRINCSLLHLSEDLRW